jgi:hypothetical protein
LNFPALFSNQWRQNKNNNKSCQNLKLWKELWNLKKLELKLSDKMAGKRTKRRILDDDDDDDEDLFSRPSQKNVKSVKKSTQNRHKIIAEMIEGLPKSCEFINILTTSGLNLDDSRDIEEQHVLHCEQVR